MGKELCTVSSAVAPAGPRAADDVESNSWKEQMAHAILAERAAESSSAAVVGSPDSLLTGRAGRGGAARGSRSVDRVPVGAHAEVDITDAGWLPK